ncbi:hypothetical protein HK101_002616 [Irineochytrium annulatum]|nr:hypothetical protein HK101_002616 [Irineochytrium annulatum]
MIGTWPVTLEAGDHDDGEFDADRKLDGDNERWDVESDEEEDDDLNDALVTAAVRVADMASLSGMRAACPTGCVDVDGEILEDTVLNFSRKRHPPEEPEDPVILATAPAAMSKQLHQQRLSSYFLSSPDAAFTVDRNLTNSIQQLDPKLLTMLMACRAHNRLTSSTPDEIWEQFMDTAFDMPLEPGENPASFRKACKDLERKAMRQRIVCPAVQEECNTRLNNLTSRIFKIRRDKIKTVDLAQWNGAVGKVLRGEKIDGYAFKRCPRCKVIKNKGTQKVAGVLHPKNHCDDGILVGASVPYPLPSTAPLPAD